MSVVATEEQGREVQGNPLNCSAGLWEKKLEGRRIRQAELWLQCSLTLGEDNGESPSQGYLLQEAWLKQEWYSVPTMLGQWLRVA